MAVTLLAAALMLVVLGLVHSVLALIVGRYALVGALGDDDRSVIRTISLGAVNPALGRHRSHVQ